MFENVQNNKQWQHTERITTMLCLHLCRNMHPGWMVEDFMVKNNGVSLFLLLARGEYARVVFGI